MRLGARTLLLLSIVVILGGLAVLQLRLTSGKGPGWFQENFSYLPKSSTVKPLLAGFHTVYANYIWIRTMVYFGEHYETDQEYAWLTTMVDMVTRLNPYFFPAYEFAGLMLPDVCANPAAARVILQRGLSALGTRTWKIPYYLGWVHYRYRDDPLAAACYFELAARHREAPAYLAGLAATLYRKGGAHEQSRLFLQGLYETTENPLVRRHVRKKLQEEQGP